MYMSWYRDQIIRTLELNLPNIEVGKDPHGNNKGKPRDNHQLGLGLRQLSPSLGKSE